MRSRKIKILHIIKDDKFFDNVITLFESDEHLENRSVLIVKTRNYEFFRIKHTEKVEILWKKDMVRECLQSSDYDAIFFHSLSADKYKIFRYIPKDKIVIWWCWGFELYSREHGMSQLIPTALYKPKTEIILKEISKKKQNFLMELTKRIVLRPYYEHLRKKVIERIDFFLPIIPLEYQLMKNVKGFHAKEFYFPRRPHAHHINVEHTLPEDGGILIGNSTSPNNNHLDVWEDIQPYLGEHRLIIMPLNYNSDKVYADKIADMITSDKHQIEKLRSFMPREEYWKLIGNCSYAVFGAIRQHAMGNIHHCLRQGIKVFLYRNSLVYRYLKAYGFVVYAIEDIDGSSFNTPLTVKELEQNAKAFESRRNQITDVRKKAFDKIISLEQKKK